MTPVGTSKRQAAGPRRVRGIATVEFVATAPFLLVLLLGGAEVGHAFIHYANLSYAVRESARYASEHSINGTTGVVTISGATLAGTRNIAVYGNVQGTGTPRLPGFQTSQVQLVDAGGGNIRVAAVYPYQPMLGPAMPDVGFGSGSFPLAFNMQVAMTLRAIS